MGLARSESQDLWIVRRSTLYVLLKKMLCSRSWGTWWKTSGSQEYHGTVSPHIHTNGPVTTPGSVPRCWVPPSLLCYPCEHLPTVGELQKGRFWPAFMEKVKNYSWSSWQLPDRTWLPETAASSRQIGWGLRRWKKNNNNRKTAEKDTNHELLN